MDFSISSWVFGVTIYYVMYNRRFGVSWFHDQKYNCKRFMQLFILTFQMYIFDGIEL